MKIGKLVLPCLLALICGMSSCDDNENETKQDTYPMTIVHGERTCTGEIISLPNPPDGSTVVPLPGVVLAIGTTDGNYLLRFDGYWAWDDETTVGDVVYTIGDQVEITGTASTTKISASDEYSELEVKTIKKLD